MKKDITTRSDIEQMVQLFYKKVKDDEIIGYIFTDVANINWEKHLPVMYDFFENMLFYTGAYTGNPMELHKHINRLIPLGIEHFEKWNELFCIAVDELFAGEKAELVKQRAKSISVVMQIKMLREPTGSDKIF